MVSFQTQLFDNWSFNNSTTWRTNGKFLQAHHSKKKILIFTFVGKFYSILSHCQLLNVKLNVSIIEFKKVINNTYCRIFCLSLADLMLSRFYCSITYSNTSLVPVWGLSCILTCSTTFLIHTVDIKIVRKRCQ